MAFKINAPNSGLESKILNMPASLVLGKFCISGEKPMTKMTQMLLFL